jgi:hypothetical protein
VDYFVPLLSGHFMESHNFQETSIIDIRGLFDSAQDCIGLDIEGFSLFLKWLYSSDPKLLTSLELHVLTDVFLIANQLGVKKLVLLCEQQLIKSTSNQNAEELLELARTFGMSRLERQCAIMKRT